MKSKLLVAFAAALVMLLPASSFAAIAGSAHDLTTHFTGGPTNPCEYCHAPHNPNPGGSPLWNHTLTTETFTMYGTTIKGNTTDSAPNTPSLRCLSCHDGVTNVDAYGGATGTEALNTTNWPGTTAVIGTQLNNDHPVSIGLSGLPAGAQTNAETAGIQFYDDAGTVKAECSSCHDPHDTTNTPFLRVSEDSLCASCHTDK